MMSCKEESETQKVKLRQPGSAERRGLAGVPGYRAIVRIVRRADDFTGGKSETDQAGKQQPSMAQQVIQVPHERLFHGFLSRKTAPFRGGV